MFWQDWVEAVDMLEAAGDLLRRIQDVVAKETREGARETDGNLPKALEVVAGTGDVLRGVDGILVRETSEVLK